MYEEKCSNVHKHVSKKVEKDLEQMRKNVEEYSMNDDNANQLPEKLYSKSNYLISSMSSSNLLENQLMAISLQKIFNGQWFVNLETNAICVNLKVNELRKLLKGNSGSFYSRLKNTAESVTGKNVGWESPQKDSFDYIAITTRMTYEKGVLTVQYNAALRNYLTNLERNFTILNLQTMLSLSNTYTFRFYELLKSQAYYKRGSDTNHKINIYYELGKLKLQLGIIDINDPKIKDKIKKSKNPDYEKIVMEYEMEKMENCNYALRAEEIICSDKGLSKAETNKRLAIVKKEKYPAYMEWSVFKRDLLDKMIEEINSIANDIFIEYDVARQGHGGKVAGINFYLTIPETKLDNIVVEDKKSLSPEEKMEFYEKLQDEIDLPLKIKDLQIICETADYDLYRIKKAYNVLKHSGKVENMVGFLISAIKNNYDVKTYGKSNRKSKNDKNSFNRIMENDYDLKKLEEEILAN